MHQKILQLNTTRQA